MEILERIKKNIRLIFSLLLVVLLTVFGLVFVFQEDKVKENITVNKPEQARENDSSEEVDVPVEVSSVSGQLMEIGETTIKILNFEKTKNKSNPENMEKNMEILNINASTPVIKGAEGETKSALYELRLGQLITILYNKNNKDVFGIIINEE